MPVTDLFLDEMKLAVVMINGNKNPQFVASDNATQFKKLNKSLNKNSSV